MSESFAERIKRLQAARDRGGQPGAPTAGAGQDRPQAEIFPTTFPTHNTKDKADKPTQYGQQLQGRSTDA